MDYFIKCFLLNLLGYFIYAFIKLLKLFVFENQPMAFKALYHPAYQIH